MATISLEDLTKYYGDIRAVEGLTFKVQEKELLTILGPSGCGKTTILRLIAGLEAPTKGDICIDGASILKVPTRDRDVAMVFQSYALYNHMTVYDNIAFPLRMRGYSQQGIDSKVKEAAELLGISHILDRKPGKLSGGEQQRVALGRAIVREPKVFLMDEPLTFLDPKLRTQMRVELKALQRRLGVTTIYVTHDQAEAMTMSDRVALIEAGILQQLDTPEEVYSKPVNKFVASFLGSPPINLIECSYIEEDNKAFLDAKTFKLNVTELKGVIDAKKKSSELILGVRPQDISASSKKSADSMEAELYMKEPLGSEVILNLRLGGSLVKGRVEADVKFKEGEKLWVSFKKGRIHVFNKSGETIV